MEERATSGEAGWTRRGGREPAPSRHILHFPSIRTNVFTSYRANVNWRVARVDDPLPTDFPLLPPPTLRHIRYIPLTNARPLTEYSPTGSTGRRKKYRIDESVSIPPPPIPTNTNPSYCSKIYPSTVSPVATRDDFKSVSLIAASREVDKYVFEVIKGGLVCILIFKKKGRKNWNEATFTLERRGIRLFRGVIRWHASHTPSPPPSRFIRGR